MQRAQHISAFLISVNSCFVRCHLLGAKTRPWKQSVDYKLKRVRVIAVVQEEHNFQKTARERAISREVLWSRWDFQWPWKCRD